MSDAATATLIAAIIALTGVVIAQGVIIWVAIVAAGAGAASSRCPLRWAAEPAVGGDASQDNGRLGGTTLIALGKSPVFDPRDQIIRAAVLDDDETTSRPTPATPTRPERRRGSMSTEQARPDPVATPTRAQVLAARGIIERYAMGLGPKPSHAVLKIAGNGTTPAPAPAR